MSRQVKGKLRLFLAYMSVLSIGVLIYIIVILFANDAKNGLSTIKSLESFGKKKGDLVESNAIPENQSGESPDIKLNVADKASLNELPDEINSAIDSIETPLESRNDSTKNADSSVPKASDFKRFPRDFVVRVKVLNVRETPSTDSAVLKRFKQGAIIRISEISGKWARLENGGWAYLSLLDER